MDTVETTKKERIRNRTRSLFERTANILPSYKEKKIELDSCDDFSLNDVDIMVIDVTLDGVHYIKDFSANEPEEFLLNWDEMLDLSEDFLQTIYDNLIGTIRNEY